MRTIHFNQKLQAKSIDNPVPQPKGIPIIKSINQKELDANLEKEVAFLRDLTPEDFFDFEKYPPSLYSGL